MTDTNAPQQPAPESIHVLVRNRKVVLIEDNVQALTARNDTGIFDVLPEHANFISVIKDRITIHKLNGELYEIPLSNGIIKVKDANVHCYIDLLSVELKKN